LCAGRRTSIAINSQASEVLGNLDLSLNLFLERVIRQISMNPKTWKLAFALETASDQIDNADDDEPWLHPAALREALNESGYTVAKGILLPSLKLILQKRLERGFFYPICTDSIESVISSLQEGQFRKGASFLRARFLSFWSAGKGPATWDKTDLRWDKVLLNQAGLSERDEEKKISWASLRQETRTQRYTVSFFQPQHALNIYRKNLDGIKNPRVWDPSGGFGARMLGFKSVFPNGFYATNEPANETHRDLESLNKELTKTGCSVSEILKSGSETTKCPSGKFDLVFTSPPYFDREKYSNEPTQSWVRFPTRGLWLQGFLRQTIRNAYMRLNDEGRLILNVNWDLLDDTLSLAQEEGFELEKQEELPVKTHFFTPDIRPNEPILTWRKR
jgi:hypothetical protein